MSAKDQVLLENLPNDCIKRTRSGRICMPPLARWAGERIVTTLQTETPTRYVAPQFIDNPVLLSSDMYERHKKMSLNQHCSYNSKKPFKRRECKSENIKTRSKDCQSIVTRSRKNLTAIVPTLKSYASTLKSREKKASTRDHLKSKSKKVINASGEGHQIDESPLVTRCLSFDTSPCKQEISQRELKTQSEQVITESLDLTIIKDTRESCTSSDGQCLMNKKCTGINKGKSCKADCNLDSQLSRQQIQSPKINNVEFANSKCKNQLMGMLSSSADVFCTAKKSATNNQRKLRTRTKKDSLTTETRNRKCKFKRINCIFSSSSEEELDFDKKISQKDVDKLHSKVSNWLEHQESLLEEKYKNQIEDIGLVNCDVPKVDDSSILRKKVHQKKTIQTRHNSNSRHEKQELSNQKTKKIERVVDNVEAVDDISIPASDKTFILEQQEQSERTTVPLDSESSDERAALTDFQNLKPTDDENKVSHASSKLKELRDDPLSEDDSSDTDLINATFVITDRNSTLIEKTSPLHIKNKKDNFKTLHRSRKVTLPFSKVPQKDAFDVHKNIDQGDNVNALYETAKSRKLRLRGGPVKKVAKLEMLKLTTDNLSKQKISKKRDCMIGLLNPGATKIPGKGTLKLRKWLAAKLVEFNKEHNDDLFEGKEEEAAFNIKNLMNLDDVLGEKYELNLDFHTPKAVFPVVSPRKNQKIWNVASSVTPSEFNCEKSAADEYLYRREQLKKAKKNQASKQEVVQKLQTQPIQRADITKRLNQMLDRLPCSDKESQPCSDEEILSDNLNDYRFSDSDESVNFMKNF